MSDPNLTFFEVHAPVTYDDLGYAYSPIITIIEAYSMEDAVAIASENFDNVHSLYDDHADIDGYTVTPI